MVDYSPYTTGVILIKDLDERLFVILNSNNLDFSRVFFSNGVVGCGVGGGVEGANLTPHSSSFIFQEELIQYQYNFIKLLNKLFRVGWNLKNNADIMLCAGLISFFVTRKCQKIGKLMKMVNINGEPSYFLNDSRNFNYIFGKYWLINNIKSHKKTRLQPLSRRHIFGKTTGSLRFKE